MAPRERSWRRTRGLDSCRSLSPQATAAFDRPSAGRGSYRTRPSIRARPNSLRADPLQQILQSIAWSDHATTVRQLGQLPVERRRCPTKGKRPFRAQVRVDVPPPTRSASEGSSFRHRPEPTRRRAAVTARGACRHVAGIRRMPSPSPQQKRRSSAHDAEPQSNAQPRWCYGTRHVPTTETPRHTGLTSH